jgi:regulatory protein
MEPHRPPLLKRDPSASRERPERPSAPPRKSPSNGPDSLPIGTEWLEREAIRYVARWETSRRSVADFLERKLEQRCTRTGEDPGAHHDLIPKVVSRMVDRGYIEDQRLAEQVFARLRRQGKSAAQIRARLQAKGIDPELITQIEEHRADQAIQVGEQEGREVEEEIEAAWVMARKRRLGPFARDLKRRKENRNKHLAVLARQGFSRETSYAVIDGMIPNEDGSRGIGG